MPSGELETNFLKIGLPEQGVGSLEQGRRKERGLLEDRGVLGANPQYAPLVAKGDDDLAQVRADNFFPAAPKACDGKFKGRVPAL